MYSMQAHHSFCSCGIVCWGPLLSPYGAAHWVDGKRNTVWDISQRAASSISTILHYSSLLFFFPLPHHVLACSLSAKMEMRMFETGWVARCPFLYSLFFSFLSVLLALSSPRQNKGDGLWKLACLHWLCDVGKLRLQS
ncbi:hypothetical protein BC939DRAFT_136680 [Gamsiella multidivaricata]|uniref:uncharacterized protein n=1 Tax=Gamsiella multidivaricata TaxID=101098 RepID=UPI00221F212E|nr:uncharacterized protein BC939DRAFT_136680 [Gamsiella multidivaricata]KAI7824869.1 hypothetical protein BC939DRAFT_136680 [Gamsiella multidivaricata]